MEKFLKEALDASWVGGSQYILEKSGEKKIVEYSKELLDYIKNGWKLTAVCAGGVEYKNYLIEDSKEFFAFKEFCKKLHISPTESYFKTNVAYVLLATTYARDTYEVEQKEAEIVFFYVNLYNENEALVDTKFDHVKVEFDDIQSYINKRHFKLNLRALLEKLEVDFENSEEK